MGKTPRHRCLSLCIKQTLNYLPTTYVACMDAPTMQDFLESRTDLIGEEGQEV